MDTSAFYKLDGDLLIAPNFIYSPTYTLLKEYKDTYTYPIGGWYWFNTIEEACAFFEIPVPEQNVL